MGGVVWLEGEVAAEEVGARATAFARLAHAGLAVPRAFVLGRAPFERHVAKLTQGHKADSAPLAVETSRAIAEAMRTLGAHVAIRRSPLAAPPAVEAPSRNRRGGGRPERETYLNLTAAAEVSEAVRRIWARTVRSGSPPAAIVVQAFVPADAAAVVHLDPADADLLHVESCLGVGDLLSAGLVLPDRHGVRLATGEILSRKLGRKAQMSVADADGGVRRLPVPPARTRAAALDDATLVRLVDVWRAATAALGPLLGLGVAVVGGVPTITSVKPRPAPAIADGGGLMLG
jgi:phosphoenolpyruvate synthase/pyruvate phosphate dikinase